MTDPTARRLTASAVVFNRNDDVLLVEHRGYRQWVFPGGHIEPGEAPHEAAIREVLEETSVVARIVAPPLFDAAGMVGHPLPFMVMEMDAAPRPDEPAHRNVDFLYVAVADVERLRHQQDEIAGARWVALAELGGLHVRHEVPAVSDAALRYWRES